jgi:Ca2+-transporting ATPase
MLLGIGAISIADTIAVLGSFLLALNRFGWDNVAAAQTVAFATMVTSELLRAYTARSERVSIFKSGVLGNKWMVYATGASFILLLVVIYVPFLQIVFGTVPLELRDWLVMAPFFLIAPIAAELTKAYLRWRAARV